MTLSEALASATVKISDFFALGGERVELINRSEVVESIRNVRFRDGGIVPPRNHEFTPRVIAERDIMLRMNFTARHRNATITMAGGYENALARHYGRGKLHPDDQYLPLNFWDSTE